MLWVFVFGGIALAGLVMLISYAVWLAHKTADVLGELSVFSERLGQFGRLVAQIQMPVVPDGPDGLDPSLSRRTGQDARGSE